MGIFSKSKDRQWDEHPGLKQDVRWRVGSGQDGILYVADQGAIVWKIRQNSAPGERTFTLLIDGKEIVHFDDWPAFWKRPGFAKMK
jgi:hypothetical protein